MWKILIILILIEAILPAYYLTMRHCSKHSNGVQKKYRIPFVSIIIPTYNEETTLPSKLNNIFSLNYPLNKVELFIVDGFSTDSTISISQNFINSHLEMKIYLIQEKERGGKIRAINRTVPLCSGELICISDSDCVWEKDALREAAANFSDEHVGAVTGLQLLMETKETAEKMEQHYNNFYNTLRLGESALDSTPIFRGELTIVRNGLFKQIDVGSESAWADDSEIAVKIRKLGYRAIVDPLAKFYEFAPPTMNSRTVQKSRRGLGLIKLFLVNYQTIIHPQKYGYYSFICFGNLFYLTISPILTFLIPSILIGILIVNSLYITLFFLLGSLLLVTGVQYLILKNRIGNFIYAFYHSQFALIWSFRHLFSNNSTWSQITEVRDKWRERVV